MALVLDLAEFDWLGDLIGILANQTKKNRWADDTDAYHKYQN